MKLTLSKFETRRVLNLSSVRDVDHLVEMRILVPAAYDPNGRPLFEAAAVRRAASRVLSDEASAE
jgi:hypothetical protein